MALPFDIHLYRARTVASAVLETGVDEGNAAYDCAVIKMLKRLTSSIHAQR